MPMLEQATNTSTARRDRWRARRAKSQRRWPRRRNGTKKRMRNNSSSSNNSPLRNPIFQSRSQCRLKRILPLHHARLDARERLLVQLQLPPPLLLPPPLQQPLLLLLLHLCPTPPHLLRPPSCPPLHLRPRSTCRAKTTSLWWRRRNRTSPLPSLCRRLPPRPQLLLPRLLLPPLRSTTATLSPSRTALQAALPPSLPRRPRPVRMGRRRARTTSTPPPARTPSEDWRETPWTRSRRSREIVSGKRQV